ncbi:MAG TPA: hypothetical protein VG248_19165 [Caulobacteraceae bacterium]|jgi:hypothetical protein|nr:hypothetical protein [Caulobacteraceae bacterium]
MDDKILAWNWARPLGRLNPADWRRDRLGNLIRFGDYADRTSVHGWEVEFSEEPGALSPQPRAIHWSARVAAKAGETGRRTPYAVAVA